MEQVVKAHHEERLSDMLKKGEKTLLDTKPEEMVVYFQAATLMGDTTSAFNLALCYHMGHGVTQDLEKVSKKNRSDVMQASPLCPALICTS